MSVTVSVSLNGKRLRRDTETVSELVTKWVCRWARRRFPGFEVEGSSAQLYPGQSYLGWWLGSVEVYLCEVTPAE